MEIDQATLELATLVAATHRQTKILEGIRYSLGTGVLILAACAGRYFGLY